LLHQWRTALEQTGQPVRVLTIDCYPGVNLEEIEGAIRAAWPEVHVLHSEDACLPGTRIEEIIAPNLTEDRVFGVMSCHELPEFLDAVRVRDFQGAIEEVTAGIVVVLGLGAALIHAGDVLVLADLPRWECQLRMRAGASNWRADNGDEDILRKYKRAYFWEWPLADRHKRSLFGRTDFLLDTTLPGHPGLVTATALRAGLRRTLTRPFRVVPFFDPGVWGGQWMKEVCGLDPAAQNYAWGFDCVPEENSLKLGYGEITLEIPAQDLVMLYPKELLGERTFARFGAQFPIRFDFLDTMNGQNLSLQVHPLVQYIQEHFGMPYTQDESYYILDAAEGAEVYLGLKDGVNVGALASALGAAQQGDAPLDAERFVNAFPVRPHDHVLIPAGTVHCSGKDTMVLEVSATPFIFTFKLWDWGRLGMDGRPRPIHLEHGLPNIQPERTTAWVQQNLLRRTEVLAEGPGWREERTGLHEFEFIETRRHWFTGTVQHDTRGTVHVLNLVEGWEAVVESPLGGFEPFTVHYAETFIVPAAVGPYTVRPSDGSSGGQMATICAFVRGTGMAETL
ncbi:MAG: class I mannose-6-phosphate isomerase, partial [Deinococcus sp.]